MQTNLQPTCTCVMPCLVVEGRLSEVDLHEPAAAANRFELPERGGQAGFESLSQTGEKFRWSQEHQQTRWGCRPDSFGPYPSVNRQAPPIPGMQRRGPRGGGPPPPRMQTKWSCRPDSFGPSPSVNRQAPPIPGLQRRGPRGGGPPPPRTFPVSCDASWPTYRRSSKTRAATASAPLTSTLAC